MKPKMLPIYLLIFFYSAAGCYFDTNTTDPMSSNNIISSKKDSLFLNAYQPLGNNKKTISVKEAWVEYSWRNETTGLGTAKTKIKTGGLQLNIMLEDTSRYFNIADFYKTWTIKNNTGDYLALSNNLCCLYMESEILPDSIYLIINRIDSSGKYYDFTDVVFVKK